MSQVLDKLERLAGMAERFEGLARTLPRLAEMFGVALLAGRASERLGGSFSDGAIGGVIADGLAHSQLPNNQVGGIALGTYFAALGALTIAPTDGFESGDDYLGYFEGLPRTAPTEPPRLTIALTREECAAQGGVWIEGILGGGCRLPDL